MVNKGCAFYTIPSVIFEFTRTANTAKGYQERLDLVASLHIVVFNRVEEVVLKDFHNFMITFHSAFIKSKKSPSYTDSLLCAMAYKHRASRTFILTSNHKDIPESIFDRTELITLDINNQIYNEALYKFSAAKFAIASGTQKFLAPT